MNDSYETNFYLGVRADTTDMNTALKNVEDYIKNPLESGSRRVYFTNVHSICLSLDDPALMECINRADMVLPDGSGLKIAGELLQKPIRENLNGTDFTPELCKMAQSKGWGVYLLGAEQEVVSKCKDQLKRMFPALKIAGIHDGYFNRSEEDQIIEEINNREPEIVLVALGSPLQEKWIARNADRLNASVCFAVGGLFDFISGKRKRAPLWWRRLGIEWMHRFLEDPKDKWDRVFKEIPYFLTRISMQKLKPQKNRLFFIR